MKAYFGFKVKGNVAYFLEQFKDFQWIHDVSNTGFLGFEIEATEYVAKNINFPKMLENYLIVSFLNENKNLTEKLMSYQKGEVLPVIFVPSNLKNKFFNDWKEYQEFLQAQ